MTTANLQELGRAWPAMSTVLFVPHSEHEYRELVTVLDRITDIVGNDETHSLASLMEILGVLVEKYEDENVAEISEL